jgi:hypothetical protein
MPVLTRSIHFLFVGLLAVALTACATSPATIPVGDNATVDADGLHKVENHRTAVVFVDPDADFSQYKKFYFKGDLPMYYRKSNRYELNDTEHARVHELYRKAFVTALTDIGLQEASAPGDDVLVITSALNKVLVNARPEPAGRSRVYVDSTGDMELLLQVSGGADKTPLIRFAEQREVRSLVKRSTSVTVNADLSRVFNQWARRLAQGLTLSPADYTVLENQG